MESGKRDERPEDRESGGPVAELVDHVPLEEALQDAVTRSAKGVDFTEAFIIDPSAPLVFATYTDADGRSWRVRVPKGAPTPNSMGIPAGPPDISSLGLPHEIMVRLHNQLFNRGLFSRGDLRGRGQEVVAALQAAYKVDASAVTALYR